MSTGGFNVAPGELTTHSQHVRSAAENVKTAVDAGTSVVVGASSFGVLFSGLGLALNGVGLFGVVVGSKVADSLDSLASDLAQTAADYAAQDQRHHEVFQEILKGVEQ